MPVSGRELASLDFANLIGGPLNAVVEAQAKSAITTANFIKEVGFDKDGKVVNVDFTYNKKNNEGQDEEFTLTLPFITMLPVPYVSVTNAVVEFNAKITSVTESKVDSSFSQTVDASAGGSWWFASARVQSKTAYQKTSSTTDREERTFDMHVRVEAKNTDMPAGTERILTMLENAITERSGGKVAILKIVSVTTASNGADKKVLVVDAEFPALAARTTFKVGNTTYTVDDSAPADKKITLTTAVADAAIPELEGKTISLKLAA